MRIVLDEANFRDLVAGRVAKAQTRRLGSPDTPIVDVELILSDIGWRRMVDAILDAATERNVPWEQIIRIVTSVQRLPPDDE